MISTLAVLALFSFVVALALALEQLRHRAVRKERNLFGEWPIRRVPPQAIDALLTPGPFGQSPVARN